MRPAGGWLTVPATAASRAGPTTTVVPSAAVYRPASTIWAFAAAIQRSLLLTRPHARPYRPHRPNGFHSGRCRRSNASSGDSWWHGPRTAPAGRRHTPPAILPEGGEDRR